MSAGKIEGMEPFKSSDANLGRTAQNLWELRRLLMKLKNYMKEGQKLPLFGIGPYLIYGIGLFTAICIILFVYVLKIGKPDR